MTATRAHQSHPDSSPSRPAALRQGFSVGQGLAAVVMAAGVFLLLGSETRLHPLGVVLLVGGIVALAAVETVRVLRRRRALLRVR